MDASLSMLWGGVQGAQTFPSLPSCRALVKAGDTFAALDRQLPHSWTTVDQALFFTHGILVASGCTVLAKACHLLPSDACRLAACAALALNTGTHVLNSILERRSGDWQGGVSHLLGLETTIMRGVLDMLQHAGASAAAVCAVLDPRSVLRWLAAAAAALEALEPTGRSPGELFLAGCLLS